MNLGRERILENFRLFVCGKKRRFPLQGGFQDPVRTPLGEKGRFSFATFPPRVTWYCFGSHFSEFRHFRLRTQFSVGLSQYVNMITKSFGPLTASDGARRDLPLAGIFKILLLLLMKPLGGFKTKTILIYPKLIILYFFKKFELLSLQKSGFPVSSVFSVTRPS